MKNLWDMVLEKKMNVVTLRFTDSIEEEFQKDYYKNSLMYLRVSFIMGVLFFSVFAWLDYQVSTNYMLFWMIRFSIVIPTILLVLVLSYSKNFHKYWQQAVAVAILIAGISILAMISFGGKPVDRTYYVGFCLVLVYGYVLIKLRFIYSFLCSAIMISIYFIIMQRSIIPDLMKFNNAFFLIAINSTVMLAGYMMEYYARDSFLHRYELLKQKKDIENININLENMVAERTQEIRNMNSKLHKQITKLRNTKRALSESEMQFRLAFESTGSAVWKVDLSSFEFSFEDVFFKLLDYPSKFVPEDDFFKEVNINDMPNFLKQLEDIKEGREEYLDIDIRFKDVSEEWKWLHLWGKISIEDSNMENLSIIGTAMDIHKRKCDEIELQNIKDNLEKSVQERTAKLLESQRALILLTEDVNDTSIELAEANKQLANLNKELEAFSYSVSHDLKTPLRDMNFSAGTLLEDYKDKLDDEGIRTLNIIKSSTSKLGKLIESLLEFSRLGTKTLDTSLVNIESVFLDAIEDISRINEEHEIYARVPSLPEVEVDKTMIRQVIMNLLSNAVKFSRKRDKTIITISYEQSEDEHIFSIRDNGVGFNMEYENKLFGVFQRLHDSQEYKGYGVGLSLVKKIILRHGGRVWANSEPEKGATFFFTIPVKKEADRTFDIDSLASLYDREQNE